MPREIGQEKTHFGGRDGLITETTGGGHKRNFWRCEFCSWELGGKNFQNNKARIHLSGDHNLRNGLVSRVCTAAPDDVKQKFAALERVSRENKRIRKAKRSRGKELLGANKKAKSPTIQSKLAYRSKATGEEVDHAWGEAFFGLDIAPRKIDHPLFREAIFLTKKSRAG